MGWCEVFTVDPSSGIWEHEILPNGVVNGPNPRVWRTRAHVCTGIPPFIEAEISGESSFSLYKPADYCRPELNVTSASPAGGPNKCTNYDYSYPISPFDLADCWMLPDDGRLKLATFGYTIDRWHDDIYLWGYFRGRNPDRSELSSELADDIDRALCWKESNWRQFTSTGLPLTNGTGDWGLMQIRQIGPVLKWDWRANVRAGKAILETKRREGKAYLSTHGSYTDDMLLRESIQRYNGGRHYLWDAANSQWIVSPNNGANPAYVPEFLRILAARPWESP